MSSSAHRKREGRQDNVGNEGLLYSGQLSRPQCFNLKNRLTLGGRKYDGGLQSHE